MQASSWGGKRRAASSRGSDEELAQAGGEDVDQRDGDDDNDDHGRGAIVLEGAEALIEREADPAGADNAENGDRADVGLETVERQRSP